MILFTFSLQEKSTLQEVVTRYKNLDTENSILKAEIGELTKRLKEVEKYSNQEIQRLKTNLNLNKDERNNVTENFKQLFSTNKQLQSELEIMQEQLGKKDFEIDFLSKNRYVCFVFLRRVTCIYVPE